MSLAQKGPVDQSEQRGSDVVFEAVSAVNLQRRAQGMGLGLGLELGSGFGSGSVRVRARVS